MCAPEFPMSSPQFNGGLEKVGRKRRRKRTKPILEEEEGNFLKRKPTAPVKPPVSKKKAFIETDGTNVIVLDSGKLPDVGPPVKEEDVTCANYEAVEAEAVIREENEKQQELDEALNQLLNQMDDPKPLDDMPFPHTREPKTCPIHLKPVELRISKNGWEYYKCPEWPCMLFCAAPEVDEYIELVQTRLNEPYRYKDDLPECFCRRVPVLKVSKSNKNYARLYMACDQKDKCDYFQWADSYLSGRNKAWKEQRLRERGNPLCGLEAKMEAARLYRQSPSYVPHWVNDGQPLIQVDERSNLIVSPPELRGQIYRPELHGRPQKLLTEHCL